MSIEEDIARVHSVTDALAGPQKVWVLTCAWLDGHQPHAGANVYTSREHALNAFHDEVFNRALDRGFDEDEAKDAASKSRAELDKDDFAPLHDDMWELHQCTVAE